MDVAEGRKSIKRGNGRSSPSSYVASGGSRVEEAMATPEKKKIQVLVKGRD